MTTLPRHMGQRYQRWDGKLRQGGWTWLVIVANGIRLALKGPRTRVVLLTVVGIIVGGSTILYVLSQLEVFAGTQRAEAIMEFVRVLFRLDMSGVSRIGEYREILWRALFLLMVRIEMFWVLVLVARVGPGLIANDLKSRALPIYFAKPVTPLTYLAGKWLVASAFIAAVTLIPNLMTLSIGVMVTGGLHTWGQTLGLAADLTLSGLAICLVGSAIVLALSSLSSDQRHVTVAWLAVCLLTAIAQEVMQDVLPAESFTGWLGCVSLRDNVVTLTEWLFSLRHALEATKLPKEAFNQALGDPVGIVNAMVVLGAWAAAGAFIAYRRVVKFSRSAANL